MPDSQVVMFTCLSYNFRCKVTRFSTEGKGSVPIRHLGVFKVHQLQIAVSVHEDRFLGNAAIANRQLMKGDLSHW